MLLLKGNSIFLCLLEYVERKTSYKGERMGKDNYYLYEYQNGKRMRNLGLLVVDRQMEKICIQVHAKQMDEVKGIVFQRENGETYVGCWEKELLSIEEPDGGMKEQEIEEYIPQSSVKYEKISRQDLSRLPRKEWRLANNSFLLHGFYNYHHLLYIEENEKVWVGVPGIYHEKEQVAASSFGFGEFRRLIDIPILLEEEEMNTYEDFGYWCRQIKDCFV